MTKQSRKSPLLTAAAAVMSSLIAAVAFTAPASAASGSTSGWVLVTGPDYGGYYYNTQSSLNYNSTRGDNQMIAYTSDSTLSGQAASAGYLGVLADLWKYNSDGSSFLCKENGWIYNTDNTTSGLLEGTTRDCGPGRYYSRGVTKTYQGVGGGDGSGYISWYTFKTSDLSRT